MTAAITRVQLDRVLGFPVSDEQWQIISAPLEPSVVVAGAGSGKTTSMAARVEIGEPQLAGVARSSRAGTKRSVKARPTSRPWPGLIGRVPRIHTLRSPFFSRIVVMLAVVTLDRTCLMSLDSGVVCTVSPFPWVMDD